MPGGDQTAAGTRPECSLCEGKSNRHAAAAKAEFSALKASREVGLETIIALFFVRKA
jgi:hypothetical protein